MVKQEEKKESFPHQTQKALPFYVSTSTFVKTLPFTSKCEKKNNKAFGKKKKKKVDKDFLNRTQRALTAKEKSCQIKIWTTLKYITYFIKIHHKEHEETSYRLEEDIHNAHSPQRTHIQNKQRTPTTQ